MSSVHHVSAPHVQHSSPQPKPQANNKQQVQNNDSKPNNTQSAHTSKVNKTA